MEEGPNGALYRLDADLSLHKLDDGIIVSNGPCWSPGRQRFTSPIPGRARSGLMTTIFDTGASSNRRDFAKIDTSGGGAADGATVDAEGFL